MKPLIVKQGGSLPTASESSPPTAGLHTLPALWPSLLLAAGIWTGGLLNPPLPAVALCWLLLIIYLLVISQFKNRGIFAWLLPALATILLSGTLVSLLFGQTLELKRGYVNSSSGSVALSGMALETGKLVQGRFGAPDRLDFILEVQAEKRGDHSSWRRVSYKVIALIENPGDVRIEGGSYLTLAAELEPLTGYANPGGFDWREYHGRRFIAGAARVKDGAHLRFCAQMVETTFFSEIRRFTASVQSRLLQLHVQLYPDPVIRSVADAILLGDRRYLNSRLRRWFVESGTVHVLVVSGLHLGFIAAAVYLLLGTLLGRGYLSASIACAVLLGYALATGGRPPVMRAWLLVSFALFALPAGRQRAVLNSLAVAFILLLLVNPSWLSDAGFQLSFAAVAGIGVGVPVIERFTQDHDWWKVRLWRWLFRLVAVCAVAQLAVAPLVAYHFGRFTPVAFIANPLVVMLAGFAVIGGFMADLVALCWLEAGSVLAQAVSFIFVSMVALARWFSSFSWSSIEVPLPGLDDLVLCWLVLWLVAMAISGGKRYVGGLLIVLLVWLNLAGWRPVADSLGKTLDITFLDCGKMTCPVARLPGGAVLLADPSGSGALSSRGARQLAGAYLRRNCGGRLDWLVVRGEGRTRWRWVRAILEDFRPAALILTRTDQLGDSTAEMLAYCTRRGIDIQVATTGDTLHSGGAKLFFSGPENIPLLEYSGKTVILAGESSAKAALELSERLPEGSVAVTELGGGRGAAGELPENSLWLVQAGRTSRDEIPANVLETGLSGAVRFKISERGITVERSR